MEKISAIYSTTYQFVYLRAKSILKREEDVQQLMKEVYIQAAEQDIADDKLFQWLGKQVYILGCNKFRKKQVREAEFVELEEKYYAADKGTDKEKTIEVICEAMEDLPDMYRATLLAFYYDNMHIRDISAVMGYSEKAIVNRLNYTHKYLIKALENYQEEHKIKVQFSVEYTIAALETWAAEHCLDENVAQNIFGSLCRELSIKVPEMELDGTDGGAKERVNARENGAQAFAIEEFSFYEEKPKSNAKKYIIIGAIAAVILLTVTLLTIMIVKSIKDKKEDVPKPPVSEETQKPDEDEEELDEEAEEEQQNTAEYILPDSDKRILTREDLQGLSKEQLRLARNEIFARYGTIFGVQDLADYFGSKSWYSPKISFDEFEESIEMNINEEKNLALINQIEEEME